MQKSLFLVAIMALALGGCGSKTRELAYKKVQIQELERYVADLEAQLAAKDAELAQLRAGTAPTQTFVTTNNPAPTDWQPRDKDVSITLSSDILFKPGSSILSDAAKKALDNVADTIKREYPGAKVRVEGHTDSQPIRRSKAENNDNWDLAGNRAQAVLHYLLSKGVTEDNLGFAGYGMAQPVTSNSTPSGQAKNRRVEIVVITNK